MATPSVGYAGKIYKGGTSTAFTGGACALVSGKTYQLSSIAQRRLDPAVAPTVKDNGVAVASSNYTINALNGEVTFISTYTPTTPITMDGHYIPVATLAKVKNFKSSLKLSTYDTTDVNQSGYKKCIPGLIDWSGSFDLFDIASGQGLDTLFTGRTAVLLELDPDGGGTSLRRGWVFLSQESQDTDANAVEVTGVQFELYDQSNGVISAGVYAGAQ